MRVLVDGLPLLGEAAIAIYLRELLLNLVAANTGHEYALLFRGFRAATRRKALRLLAEPTFAQFQAKITRVPDRLLEWCWTLRSLHLPLTEILFGRPDLFLSTIYLTPVLRGVTVVMIAYDLIPLRFAQFYGQDQPLLAMRLHRGLERADAILAISESTKRDFVELLGADPTRIHVVYPAADARFGPVGDIAARNIVLARYRLRQPYLLYVGSLAPHKNVGTLVRVFRRLKQVRGIPHQLVLCGRAAWGQEVVEAARDLIGVGECVVVDFIPAPDVPHLYHGAEAFVYPSLYEGFGLPPLEAMACGVPVVVSDAGSLPEVVGDAGLQVPPTDELAIEDAIYQVLTDAGLRQELRARGFRQATRFSWPETARQTLKVFAAARGAQR
ncbi:MAG: glycosyltransferase family 4 protein [Anaerolineae bacterium]